MKLDTFNRLPSSKDVLHVGPLYVARAAHHRKPIHPLHFEVNGFFVEAIYSVATTA